MNAARCFARNTLALMRMALALALTATLAHAAPENGWWWNPAQPGSGFFFEVQDGQAFMAGYLYAPDGRATWLASNGPMLGDAAYDGSLQSFAGGQTLVGDYRAPSPAGAGSVSLRFSNARHGTLAWAGISVPIERYDYTHGAAAAFQPRTGWWWNPDESGRGLSIEVQGDRMFLAGFMYDDSGNPVWYAADALMESPTHFRGALVQYAGGQALAQPYRAPSGPFVAGTIAVDFSAVDRATVTFTDDGAVPAKRVKIITIRPLLEKKPVSPGYREGARQWAGGFDEFLVITDDVAIYRRKARATFMTWEQDDLEPLGTGYPRFYKLTEGIVTLEVTLEDPRSPCTSVGTAAFDLTGGDLTVNADLTYTATIPQRTYTVPQTVTCPTPDGVITIVTPIPTLYELRFGGTLAADGGMRGEFPDSSLPYQSYSGTWDFVPRF